MPGLLLPPRRNEDTELLGQVAHHVGWKAGRAPSYQIPASIVHDLPRPITVYGDPLFAELAADAFGLSLLEPPMDWLPGLPELFRKRHVALTTLAEARTIASPTFIKPAADKSFPAKVYTSTDELAAVTMDLPDDMPLLVSEPIAWESEFRMFLCEGRVVTGSVYFRNGDFAWENKRPSWKSSPDEIVDAIQFAALAWNQAGGLPRGVVVDVGIIAGKGWAVVEANPAWASGLYGCEPIPALQSIAASVAPRDDVPEYEQRFVRAPITVER